MWPTVTCSAVGLEPLQTGDGRTGALGDTWHAMAELGQTTLTRGPGGGLRPEPRGRRSRPPQARAPPRTFLPPCSLLVFFPNKIQYGICDMGVLGEGLKGVVGVPRTPQVRALWCLLVESGALSHACVRSFSHEHRLVRQRLLHVLSGLRPWCSRALLGTRALPVFLGVNSIAWAR